MFFRPLVSGSGNWDFDLEKAEFFHLRVSSWNRRAGVCAMKPSTQDKKSQSRKRKSPISRRSRSRVCMNPVRHPREPHVNCPARASPSPLIGHWQALTKILVGLAAIVAYKPLVPARNPADAHRRSRNCIALVDIAGPGGGAVPECTNSSFSIVSPSALPFLSMQKGWTSRIMTICG